VPSRRVGCEEVASQDRLGLRAQEQRPRRPGPPWRGIDGGLLQDLPYRRRRDSCAQPGQFPVDPAIAPAGVLAGQPQDQGPDVPAGSWPAGLALLGPGGPSAADDVVMPAQDRVRGDQQSQPVASDFGYHAAQDQDLCGLPHRRFADSSARAEVGEKPGSPRLSGEFRLFGAGRLAGGRTRPRGQSRPSCRLIEVFSATFM
jgi:hypothetical protein